MKLGIIKSIVNGVSYRSNLVSLILDTYDNMADFEDK